MAIQSWPSSDVMTAFRVERVSFRPHRPRNQSRDGHGVTFKKDLGPTLHRAQITSGPLYHDEARQIMALVGSMEDQLKCFYVWDPTVEYPQADPKGTILGSSTPQVHTIDADGKRIRVKGLPNGYVLTRGDNLETVFATPARRALYQVVDAIVTADGSGITPLFEVTPFLRVGLEADDAVNLIRPKIAMTMLGDIEPISEGAITRLSFEAIEFPNENL